MNGGSSGAGGKVLAALIIGRGLRYQLVHGGWAARLADWMLTSPSLTGAISTSGRGGERGSLGRRRLASVTCSGGGCQHAVNSERGRLLMSASEGVGRWRRKRSHLGGRIEAAWG